MPPVRRVEWAFFPLDEKLALLPGSLVPSQEEHLVHLATWMPFERAAQMLHDLTGVQVSEATGRRHAEQMGEEYEGVQNEQSCALPNHPRPLPADATPPMVLSADGA